MKFKGRQFDMYKVENEKHEIVLHGEDTEDALFCAREGWNDLDGATVTRIEDEYPDLPFGVMRDLRKNK